MEVDWAITLAIEEAITAGVYRRAARLNVETRRTWEALARPHSRAAKRLLDSAITRLDAASVEPCSRDC